jgi:hypothetical protein
MRADLKIELGGNGRSFGNSHEQVRSTFAKHLISLAKMIVDGNDPDVALTLIEDTTEERVGRLRMKIVGPEVKETTVMIKNAVSDMLNLGDKT